eukprot:TRINITY_DN77010_c0_g1_i1.p1 TRINITY_DN77010_c0_g1~~TRINITY_DN77010_c0_g1_i1.p1  ORF type:complete len:192 (+),score=56.17 TRINITY_DN77010_c0_g1_i1:18-593(+)
MPPPPDLTLEEVLELQADLFDGFSDESFQKALKELEAIHGKAYKKYTDEHTRLFLTVQNKILPKYGFELGQAGVLQMLAIGARYNSNEEVRGNRALLNELIGMAPPLSEEQEEMEQKAAMEEIRGIGDGRSEEEAARQRESRRIDRQLLVTENLRWTAGPFSMTRPEAPPRHVSAILDDDLNEGGYKKGGV